MKTLILYLSYDGQTYKIANTIAKYLAEQCECDVLNLRLVCNYDLLPYQRVVIGASIRYGHFAKELKCFIHQKINWLSRIPSAFYSVNLTARKANNAYTINAQTRKFLMQTTWHPDLCAVFAGALHYTHYRWFDRLMIQLIMYITGGETDSTQEIEYTNWKQVSEFAGELAQLTDIIKKKRYFADNLIENKINL